MTTRTESAPDDFLANLEAALPSANVPTLLLLLYQFTGDDKWLSEPFRLEKSKGLDDNDTGGLSPELQEEIRSAAFDAMKKWHVGEPIAHPQLSLDHILAMFASTEGEPLPESYAPVMLDRMERQTGRPSTPLDLDEEHTTLIVGAGMSGICAAIRFEQAGVPYVIVEKQENAGGVWFRHRYPGCGVDTPSHLYSYTFEIGNWSKFFALQPEIEAYFRGVADKYGITEKIRFGTECVSLQYDEESQAWTSTLKRPDGTTEELRTRFVLSAMGAFTAPKDPNIPGLRDFQGEILHTANWDPECDLAGKRVAVIGNGASAMQVVPEIADSVDKLVIFQRSKQWAAPFPKFRMPVPDAVRFLIREVPPYAALYRARLTWIFDSSLYPALQKDPTWQHPERSLNARNDAHRRYFSRYVLEQLEGDEELAGEVIPDYPPFGKRMLLDNGWYRTLLKDNVDLVNGGAARIDETTVHGLESSHEVDVIILATGYDVVRYLTTAMIIGRDGLNIRDAWDDDDSRAYLGTVVPGFPNFFMLYGPNTQLGHGGSFVYIVECQIDYILSAIGQMAENGLTAIECRLDVYDQYNKDVQERHSQMIWSHKGMSTYYRNARGRIVTNNPWQLAEYWQFTRKADLNDFVTTAAHDRVSEVASR